MPDIMEPASLAYFSEEEIQEMSDSLLEFMERHHFETIDDFKGHSVQFFTTHADLVSRQAAAKAAEKAKKVVTADEQWSGDDFVEQSDALSRG